MKWVYWGWTALGVGAVAFVFIGAHGWDSGGDYDYLTGAEVFWGIVTIVVVPAWIAGYVIAWALGALVHRLTSATRRHRSIAKRV